MNTLYYGDNLDILRRYVRDETVDLVYLDPPFKSNQDYNVLFAEQNGTRSAAQIKAFEDTWRWDEESARTYQETVETGPEDVSKVMQAFRTFLGENDMLAYLSMMAPRLVELRRVLKPTGSIYLHCDPTASHYLKLLMDGVFGPVNFRSEVTWKRTNVHSDSKDWSGVADILLYYVRDSRASFRWNPKHLKHSEEHIASKYQADENRRLYTLSDMTSPHPRPNMMYEWKGHSSPSMGWRYSKETMAKLDSEGRIWEERVSGTLPRTRSQPLNRDVGAGLVPAHPRGRFGPTDWAPTGAPTIARRRNPPDVHPPPREGWRGITDKSAMGVAILFFRHAEFLT